jgi:hypothetical protein
VRLGLAERAYDLRLPLPALDLGAGRHHSDDMPDLLQGRHARVPMGRFAQVILSPKAHLLREIRLEALGLLDVERLEVSEFGVGFEPVQGLRDAVERRLAEAFGLSQIGEVRALDPSFWGLCVFMSLSLLAGVTGEDSALSYAVQLMLLTCGGRFSPLTILLGVSGHG